MRGNSRVGRGGVDLVRGENIMSGGDLYLELRGDDVGVVVYELCEEDGSCHLRRVLGWVQWDVKRD